jgi:hypothetical protein
MQLKGKTWKLNIIMLIHTKAYTFSLIKNHPSNMKFIGLNYIKHLECM